MTILSRNGTRDKIFPSAPRKPMTRLFTLAVSICAAALAQPPAQPPGPTAGAAQRPPRPPAPTRDPHTPGYVTAKELPDGAVPPSDADGNFIMGPTHAPAPEMAPHDGLSQGTVYNFTMESAD